MRIESEVGRVVVRTREAIIDGRDQFQRAEDREAEVQALRAEVRRLRMLLRMDERYPGARQSALDLVARRR